MSVQTSAGTMLTHAVKPGCADSWVCSRKERETRMTLSPRLPAGFVCDAAEPGPTDAEMNRMTELALCRGARGVAVGGGRSAPAARAVAALSVAGRPAEG